jgi:hypothetical protein
MNKKAYAFFLKKNRPRNKVAQELSDGRYYQRVVKNKKAYDRKKHSKISSRDSEWEMSDV